MQSAQDLIQQVTDQQAADQRDPAMLYPPSIVKWELEHHIVREERNGMIYIRCLDFDAFNEQIDREKQEFRKQNLRRRIAAAQDAAYLGEQQTMDLSARGAAS